MTTKFFSLFSVVLRALSLANTTHPADTLAIDLYGKCRKFSDFCLIDTSLYSRQGVILVHASLGVTIPVPHSLAHKTLALTLLIYEEALCEGREQRIASLVMDDTWANY